MRLDTAYFAEKIKKKKKKKKKNHSSVTFKITIHKPKYTVHIP